MQFQAGNKRPQLNPKKIISAPFKTRKAHKIDEELGLNAAPEGFVSVPIYTYMENKWEDPLSVNSC